MIAHKLRVVRMQIRPLYFSEQGAATYCGITEHLFESLHKKGVGPAYIKLTRKTIIYAKRDLDTWLGEHRIEPGTKTKASFDDVLKEIAA